MVGEVLSKDVRVDVDLYRSEVEGVVVPMSAIAPLVRWVQQELVSKAKRDGVPVDLILVYNHAAKGIGLPDFETLVRLYPCEYNQHVLDTLGGQILHQYKNNQKKDGDQSES